MNPEPKADASGAARPDVCCSVLLKWHKGVEVGTAGKDEKGRALWNDGDTLLAIVETNQGREISVVHISCDEHYFTLEDSNGDMWGWDLDDIEFWAKLDDQNLPAFNRTQREAK